MLRNLSPKSFTHRSPNDTEQHEESRGIHNLLSFSGSAQFLAKATTLPLSPKSSKIRFAKKNILVTTTTSNMNEKITMRNQVLSCHPLLGERFDLLLEHFDHNETKLLAAIQHLLPPPVQQLLKSTLLSSPSTTSTMSTTFTSSPLSNGESKQSNRSNQPVSRDESREALRTQFPLTLDLARELQKKQHKKTTRSSVFFSAFFFLTRERGGSSYLRHTP